MAPAKDNVIPIKRIDTHPSQDNINIRSILIEIQAGLDQLSESGSRHIIDLGAIPLAGYEREKLFELLGQGEVHIHLSLLGTSEIYETLFSGVWVVKHRDELEEFSSMFIEICHIPDIVLSQQDDIVTSNSKLQELINNI